MLLEQKQRTGERLELILGCHDLTDNEPYASPWTENAKEGQLIRRIFIPDGMTLEDGLRAVGGYSPADLDCVAVSHPEPLSTGSMLMLRR
jgi:hypothetical protein